MTQTQITILRLLAWILLALSVLRIVLNVTMGDWSTLIDCFTIASFSIVVLVATNSVKVKR